MFWLKKENELSMPHATSSVESMLQLFVWKEGVPGGAYQWSDDSFEWKRIHKLFGISVPLYGVPQTHKL